MLHSLSASIPATTPALVWGRNALLRARFFFWTTLLGVTLALPASGAPVASSSSAATPPAAASRVADRLIVRLKDGADLAPLHRTLQTRGRKLWRGARGLRRADLELVELPAGRRDAVIAALRASGLVDYVESDYVLRLQTTEPDDYRFWSGEQWGLKNTGVYGGTVGADIDAPSAWDLGTAAPGVVVAVVDTGIRFTHEDLRDNLWSNPGEIGTDASGRDRRTNGVDDDGDGYVDDVHGMNAINHSGNPVDDFGHGSHVAGIIGARGNNGVGIAGVAWRVKLMPLKAIDANGNGTISQAIECLDYAREHGARVVNASWGSTGFTSQALRDAIANLRSEGIIMVAACGNSSGNNDATPLFPASYEFDNIIAVAASTRTDEMAPFSNWGATTVDLAAPGAAVFSAWNGTDNDYRAENGTSQAAPHVTGAVAMLWALNPQLGYRDVIRFILENTDPLAAFAGKSVTGGRLNLAQAMAALTLEAPGDLVGPAVAMLRPQLASTVRGTSVQLQATATDSFGVVGVQFTVDGHNVGPEITAPPYVFTWNSRTVANGRHLVGATARDAAGNRTNALAGTVTVGN